MADQRRSKFRQSQIAQKALLTSSASRRFRAEDPEEKEYDLVGQVKKDIGTGEEHNLDELRLDSLETLDDATLEQEGLLLSHISDPAKRVLAQSMMRDERRRRRNVRRKAELEALGGLPSRETAVTRKLSPYAENKSAKQLKKGLMDNINPLVANRQLVKGPTFMYAPEDPDFTRVISSLEEQILTSTGERETGRITPLPEGVDVLAENLPFDEVRYRNVRDKANVDALRTRIAELDVRRGKLKERLQKQQSVDVGKGSAEEEQSHKAQGKIKRPKPSYTGVPPRTIKVGPKFDLNDPNQPHNLNQQEVELEVMVQPPKGQLGMSAPGIIPKSQIPPAVRAPMGVGAPPLVRPIPREKEVKALGKIRRPISRPDLGMDIETSPRISQTKKVIRPLETVPERSGETPFIVKRVKGPSLKEQKSWVEHQLAQSKKALRTIKADAVLEDGTVRTPEETARIVRLGVDESFRRPVDPLGPGHGRLRTLPRVASDKEIEAFINYSVDSWHAPTYGLRADAAQKAKSLAAKFTQRTQSKVERRTETSIRNSILNKLGIDVPPPGGTGGPPGAPPGSDPNQPPPEPPAPDNRPKTYLDPRLPELTVEDIYQRSGHLRTAPRLRWEASTLKKAITGEERHYSTEKAGKLAGIHPSRIAKIAKIINEPTDRKWTDEDVANLRVVDEAIQRGDNAQYIRALANDRLSRVPTKPDFFEAIRGRKIVGPDGVEGRVGGQIPFTRSQARNRWKGFISGTEILGVDVKGNPLRPTRFEAKAPHKVRVATTPNILYEYKIKNPKFESEEAINALNDLERLKDLPETLSNQQAIKRAQDALDKFRKPLTVTRLPEDQRRKFEEGEIVAPVRTIQRQAEPLSYEWGKRVPKLRGPGSSVLPPGIDEIRYIPTPGGKGEGRTVADKEHTKNVYLVRKTSTNLTWPVGPYTLPPVAPGEPARQIKAEESSAHGLPGPPPPLLRNGELWYPVDRAEYDRTEVADRDIQGDVARQIYYRYVDPKHLELEDRTGRDIARLRQQAFKIPKTQRTFGERLLHVPLKDNEVKINPIDLLYPTSLLGPTSTLSNIPSRILTEHAQMKKTEAADLLAEPPSSMSKEEEETLQKRYGIRSRDEARLIRDAAAAAGYFATKDRVMKGTLPRGVNKIIAKAGVEDFRFPVHQSVISPFIESTAQLKPMIRHPLSSPTGDLIGIDIDRWKYRQEGIPRPKMAQRVLERDTAKLARISNTISFVEKHKNQRGPVGTFTRWRLEALSKSPNYRMGDEGNYLGETARKARLGVHEGMFFYDRATTGEKHVPVTLDLKGVHQAQKLDTQYRVVKKQLQSNPFSAPSVGPGFISRGIHKAGTERNIMYGAAAVGTAAGAAYLYHRHQQSKRPSEERVSFYNKALPPSFNTPRVFPKIGISKVVHFGQSTGMQELGLAGKSLPVGVNVDLVSKRFAVRPMDRGYDANLPLVGRPSFRGTKGGSAVKGIVYEGQYKKKSEIGSRRIKRGTHDVSVLGHKLPGTFTIGDRKKIHLVSTNPNRLQNDDIENIIWAHQGTSQQEHVKNFYRGAGGDAAERLLEKWEDPDEVRRIMRQKVRESREGQAEQRRAMRELRRVTSATARR